MTNAKLKNWDIKLLNIAQQLGTYQKNNELDREQALRFLGARSILLSLCGTDNIETIIKELLK
jgi:hypothetical protein